MATRRGAEFIRLQIEVARRWPGGHVYVGESEIGHRYRKISAWTDGRDDLIPLIERENTLFRTHGARWLGELPEPIRRECSFQRGFPAAIEIALADLLQHGEQWLRQLPAPVVHVKEIGRRRPMPPLDIKQLLTEEGVKAFTEQQFYTGVGEGARELAASPVLSRLQRLNLSCDELAADQVAELLRSPHFPEVTLLRPRQQQDRAARRPGIGIFAETGAVAASELVVLRYWSGRDARRRRLPPFLQPPGTGPLCEQTWRRRGRSTGQLRPPAAARRPQPRLQPDNAARSGDPVRLGKLSET